MAENSAISWTDHTFNPWIGCTKVSPACDFCYAEAWNKRFDAGVNWGPGAPRRRTSAANWRKPIKWNREAEEKGVRYRVFCASLADVFDNAVDPEWRADLFDLIRVTPYLDWLLLTKRIGNVQPMIGRGEGAIAGNGNPYVPGNVWLGATIANQAEANRDVPKLLMAKRDLGIRTVFLSMEPLLGRVDLRKLKPDGTMGINALTGKAYHLLGLADSLPCVDWVIAGGESGRNARSAPVEWFASLSWQCEESGVAFHMKQLSEADYPDTFGDFDTFPEEIRIRELPNG